ncbi:MAG: NAD(P)H-binding protein [Actinomycetota bacterium]|nr:NAD(P)H-binding protein [Actinomycetota bacterium]
MRIVVFGANGPTGRLLTTQALGAGHEVRAVTRRPDDFPLRHADLRVVGADARDARAVSGVVEGTDAVLSTLGVPFTRKPIDLYSVSAGNIVDAMAEHGVKRLVVVSSSATEPHHHADAGFLLNRVMQPLVTATIGKSTYADMREMEAVVRASDLSWTIVRPSGLFDLPEITAYRIDENQAPGAFTARVDLAAGMLAQVEDDRFVHSVVALTTTVGTPSLWQLLKKEAF